MGLHIEGAIGRNEVEEFLKVCERNGWMVLGNPTKESNQIEYLDKTMAKRVVLVGEETTAWVQGH